MKKLLFPLPIDITDKSYASGSFYNIFKGLKKNFEIIPIGPLKLKRSNFQRGINKLFDLRLSPGRFSPMHTWKTINGYAEQLQVEADKVTYDAIFSTNTLLAAGLITTKPVFCYTDFSFSNALNYYPFASHLFPNSQIEALAVDSFCFHKHTITFLASEWARQETIKAYNLPVNKIVAIARGANLTSDFNHESITRAINARLASPIKKLLFVGIDWERKGGHIAFSITKILYEQGFNVRLQIVGCKPPAVVANSPFVEVFPFLNRNNENELTILKQLFESAFVFILPTKAEAMGIVFAEAASFGLPSIAYQTGGVGAAIDDTVTGLLFNFDDPIKKMAINISGLINKEDKYFKMSLDAFTKYKSELNWDVIALKIKNIIDPLL
jgi:glycosyltransferase involved in cell wall biosynthesis